MKCSSLALFIFFSLLLVGCSLSYARKEPATGDYWKSVMKDQPMPKAIQDLLHQDPDAKKMDHFNKDFDMKANVIIYHSHPGHEKENNQEEDKKSLVKGPSNTQQQKGGLN